MIARARRDMDELRELLSAWRDAKRSAWRAVVTWAVRLMLAMLLIGIAVRLRLTDLMSGYATGAERVGNAATDQRSTRFARDQRGCGQIVTHNAALAAAALVSFTVSNSEVAATDTINLNLQSGNATAGAYRYWIDKVSGGSFVVALENRSGGSLSEALTFNFAVVKAVAA